MGLLSSKSEYAGIRIAMHDALQRYYANAPQGLTDDEKVVRLQQLIQEACNDNRLLGNRAHIVGKAWAEFLGTRSPQQIAAFIADPEVVIYSTPKLQETPLREKAASLNFMDAIALLFKARNFAFEQIAQRTGLVDYVNGETLSQHLLDAEAQLVAQGLEAVEKTSEDHSHLPLIHMAFDTPDPYGNVDPAHLGHPPASRASRFDQGRDEPRGR